MEEDKSGDNVTGESQPISDTRRVTLPSASAARAKEPNNSGVSYRRSRTAPVLSTSDRESYEDLCRDIDSLKKVDFIKTYSRSRRPKGLKTMSTTTSPIGSPTLISPTADTGNVGISSGRRLNRSLSLKLLTERLKSGRPHPEVSETKYNTRETPTRDFTHTSAFGTLRRVFPKSRNMSEKVATKPEFPHATEHNLTTERESSNSKEQTSDKSNVIDSDSEKRQQTRATDQPEETSNTNLEENPLDGKDDGSKTYVSSCVLGMSQPQDTKPTIETEDVSEKVSKKGGDLSEDEGVESGDQTSVKSVDSKMPASQRPQRRSGAASLAMSGKIQEMFASLATGGDSQGESSKHEEQAPRRLSRRAENGVGSTGQKTSTLRFVTHPPQSKTSHTEGGSVDSNGLGSLKPQAESFSSEPNKLAPQESNVSLTDSHISGADSDFDSSYSEVVQGVASDGSDPDRFEKRNGKSLKQKSKSDPSGAKNREGLELPSSPNNNHAQSAPDIVEGKAEAPDLPEFKVTDDEAKTKSQSEDVLSKHGRVESPEPEVHTPFQGSHDPLTTGKDFGHGPAESLGQRDLHTRYADYSHSLSPIRTECERPTRRYASPSSVKSPSSSSHDRSYPFTEKNHPYTLLLSVPPPRKPILRSASSASVLQRERRGYYSPVPCHYKEVEPVRKYSATTDEPPSASALRAGTSVPEFAPPIGDSMGLATSMPDVWQPTAPPMSPETDIPYQFFKDKRYHIVEELYRNEKEYVDALKTLKEKYMSPLKSQCVLDDSVVDHIFYMVPEILIHHSIYLDFLDNVWKNWDSRNSTVGNIIINIFSKQTVLDSYLSFVENYKSSGKVIESASLTKSSVSKFLDLCQRESGSKLTIKDLIVRPIQRIPRYELLLQRLIENTPKNHPDAPLLQEAEKVMHDLAVKIGTATESKQEEDMQETLKKLEILLVTELNAPERTYLRHDMVSISNKKDLCCVWLFSDVLIISSVKRKSGPVTRKVSIILKTPYGQDYAENIKHKTWLRVGLDDIEILKSSLSRWPTFDKEQVEDDLVILNQMNDLCMQLQCNHQILEEAVKDLASSLNDQLTDYHTRNPSAESNKLELLVTTQEGVLHLLVNFASPEKRAVWEASFSDAKLKLSLLSDKRAPEFLQPLQITKTRAGMQFSCAAPIDGLNANGYRDVWVCNSDGYVGHMCLLSLQPEPIVTLNTPVPGCNARILCICSVPAFNGPFRRKGSNKSYRQRTSSGRTSPHVTIERPETPTYGGDEDGYQSDSESSDDDPIAFKATRTEDNLLKAEESPLPSPVSTEPMTTSGSWTQDPHKSTMWLGTEDGCIHIFQCTDNIKTTKNKLKIQHGASVYCIVYLDNKVFLSLANGIVVVYRRDQDGFWATDCPIIRCLGSANAPITKMLAVAGKMWCGCQQNIFVVNPGTLNTECSFSVTPESSVQCLVTSGQGVWIACQHSARVLLYHATSYEYLLEVSVAQAVAQKLQSADDIIRQHKAACLRITALLICKDLLWVGTSAGVILTIPIPKITSTTTRGTLTVPAVTGLVYGHTGHVRFLTTIELPTTTTQKLEINSSDDQANENLSLSDIQRRASMATPATMATRMLIISGGDGYEDFRNNASNEAAGRDDSTNHLLLWQV